MEQRAATVSWTVWLRLACANARRRPSASPTFESTCAISDAAQVLVHQFDTIDGYNPARADGPSWLFSTERPQWSDRVSAGLINERLRSAHLVMPIYSDVTAGVVFHPEYVRVLCSYDSDVLHGGLDPLEALVCLRCVRSHGREGPCTSTATHQE